MLYYRYYTIRESSTLFIDAIEEIKKQKNKEKMRLNIFNRHFIHFIPSTQALVADRISIVFSYGTIIVYYSIAFGIDNNFNNRYYPG